MKPKETIDLYRVLSLLTIVLTTFALAAMLSVRSHLYPDEWLCMLFLTLLYLMISIFELEYERRKKGISANTKTTFIRLAAVYTACCLLTFGVSLLPEFYRPVMIPVIMLSAVSNSMVAMTMGLFFDLLLALTVGGSFYALAGYMTLTVLGAVLSHALREKTFRIYLTLLTFCTGMLLPELFDYLSSKEINPQTFLYGISCGVVSAFFTQLVFSWLAKSADNEIDNHLLDMVAEDYSEVKALKDFSMAEYEHAHKVSDIACRCASHVGYRASLCLAGGFYYRMGRWIGEPYIKNAVDKAESLCFPEDLTLILSEYYGEEHLPSSPESALVHMVDAIVIRLEAMEKDVGKSAWNRDMVIYQALNEFSASGIYDESGVSMNQFLKIREFLAEEELLQ